jgi:hypothetical protein
MLYRYLRYGVVCVALFVMCGLSIVLVNTRVLAVNTQQSACTGTPVPINPPSQPPPATPVPTKVIQPTPSPVPVPTATPIPDPVVSPTATVGMVPTEPVVTTTPTAIAPSTVTVDTTTPVTRFFTANLLQSVAFTICTPTPVPTIPAGDGGTIPQPTTTNGQPAMPTSNANTGTPHATKQKKAQATPIIATPQPTITSSSVTPQNTAASTEQKPVQQSSSLLLWILLGVGSVVLLAGGAGTYWLIKRGRQTPGPVQPGLAGVPQTPAIPWAQQKTLEPTTLSATNDMTIASPVLAGASVASAALIPPPLDKNVVLPPPPAHALPAAQPASPFSTVHVQPPVGQPSGANFTYKPAELQPLSVSLSQTLSMAGNQQPIMRENRASIRQPSMDGLDFASLFDKPKQTAGVASEQPASSTDHTAAVTKMTTFPPITPEEATGQESDVELPMIQNDPLLETIMKQAQFGIYAPATRKLEMQSS